MLGKAMRKYVMGEKGKRYSKAVQNVYNCRIRQYTVQALKDLVLLSEKLPEDRQAEIFNEKTLTPLIKNLFRLIPKDFVDVVDLQGLDKDELEKRRKRVLALCHVALEEIGEVFNARNLAPDIMRALTEAGPQDASSTMTGLRAVYNKSLPR
jgi:hypothetical protein